MSHLDPIFYVDSSIGAALCKEHGEALDDGESLGAVFSTGDPENILQTCDVDNEEFCGNCGVSGWFEITTRKHHGHHSSRTYSCQNCKAQVRFIEGYGAFERWGCGDGHWHHIEGTS